MQKMERLVIKGLKLKGFHGTELKEKEKGQEFIFDIFLYFPFPDSDCISKTIDYLEVIREVEGINKEPCALIETLAKRIRSRLYSRFKPERVFVSIKKPNPPISYSVEYVGINIEDYAPS